MQKFLAHAGVCSRREAEDYMQVCHNDILICLVGKAEREIVVQYYLIIVKEGVRHCAEGGVHSTDEFFS